MRNVLFFLFVSVSFPVIASSEDAYVIIKSSVKDGERQPTWICMARAILCTHIPANKEIVKITPGTYRLHHIDFRKSIHRGLGSQFFEKPIKFKLKAGNIYFIGHLKLTKRSMKKYRIEIDQDTSQIKEACMSAPDIFRKYPLASVTNSKKLRINCDDTGNNPT